MNPEDTAAIALPIIDIFSIILVEDYSASTDEVNFGVVKKSMASVLPFSRGEDAVFPRDIGGEMLREILSAVDEERALKGLS